MSQSERKEFDKKYPEMIWRERHWIDKHWRPCAAIVYLIICLFDFIIAPLLFGMRTEGSQTLANSVKGLDSDIAISIIHASSPWEPLTLKGSGLFHVAFGAILGVAAWTRGSEQIEVIRQMGESERSPYTPTMVPTYVFPNGFQNPSYPVPHPVEVLVEKDKENKEDK
jgi:hypothetical protein